jgi:hypothetical protein
MKHHYYIDSATKGISASTIIDSVINDVLIRSYFDAYGDLKFCSLNDVLIDPTSDYRLTEIHKSVKNNHKLVEFLGSYQGSLNSLYQRIKTKAY